MWTPSTYTEGQEATWGDYKCKYFLQLTSFISWLKSLTKSEGVTWYGVYQTYLVQRGLPANYLETSGIATYQAISTFNTNILGVYYDIPQNWAIIPGTYPGVKYSCSFCDATFDTNEALLAHVAEKHATPPIGYTCPICGATFDSDAELQVHKQIHTPIPQPLPKPTPTPTPGTPIGAIGAFGLALLVFALMRKRKRIK